MPARFDGWTMSDSDTGCGNGPCGDDPHCVDGKMDIQFGPATMGDGYVSDLSERFDVPYEYDFHSQADVSFALGRVDVPDPVGDYGAPAPFHGGKGEPLDFMSVGDRAADHDHGEQAPDGRSAPPASDIGPTFGRP